jgi:hypothetical protein
MIREALPPLEEFKDVPDIEMKLEKPTPNIIALMKDKFPTDPCNQNEHVVEEDRPRSISDSINLSRPPVSENILDIIFSSDYPVRMECMKFLEEQLQLELASIEAERAAGVQTTTEDQDFQVQIYSKLQ